MWRSPAAVMKTAAQGGQAQALRAANKTAVARLEAHGTKTLRTTGVYVTSPAKVFPTTRFVAQMEKTTAMSAS